MEVRHNTSLLEKAVEHAVHSASIPSRKAEAAARQVEAKAQAFKRLATGAAVAVAAVGIGFGVWLAMQEPKNADANVSPEQVSTLEKKLQEANRTNEAMQEKQQAMQQELDALRLNKDPSRSAPADATEVAELRQKASEQQQALQEADRTITDLRQRLDSMTGGDPLTNYSIFKNKLVNYKGKTWEVSTGHEFASNLDKQWRAAWCYVTPDVDNVRLKVDLVERSAPDASPQAPVATPQTLAEAGLDNADALYLGSQCDWLDGKTYSAAQLGRSQRQSSEEAAISREGDALLYKGDINEALVDLLKTSSFRKLILTSNGGSVSASLEAGEFLRRMSATVEVRERCFSACVFVAAGGTQRLSQPGAEIGVHQFYFTDSTDSASATALAQQTSSLIVQYLQAMGVDPELFHEMVKVPSTEILVLPTTKLVAWRLLQSQPDVLPTPTEKQFPQDRVLPFRTVFEARDMVGGDSSLFKEVSQDTCEKNCQSDSLCKGYTYDRWNRLCLLKSGVGLLRLEPRSITVLFSEQAPRESSAPLQMTKRNGRAFPNAPYDSSPSDGYDQCATMCLEDRQCLGVNLTPEGRCELFAAPSEYSPRPGFILGIKTQVSSTE